MALRFVDSFDHYAYGEVLKKYTNFYSGSGNRVWDFRGAGAGRNGTNGLYAYNPTGAGGGVAANVYVRKRLDNQETWILGCALITSAGGGGRKILGLYDTDGAAYQTYLTVSGGVISFTRNGTVLASTGALLQNGQQYYIEVKVTIGNAGSYEVRLNGNTVLSGSGVDTQYTANAYADAPDLFMYQPADAQSIGFDDYYVCDGSGTVNNDFLGDIRVQAVYPDADGTYSDFTGQDGDSVDNRLNVDEAAPDSDTTYNASANAGDKDSFGFGDITPTAAVIKGIQVTLDGRKDDAGSRQVRGFLRIGGTDYPCDTADVLDTYNQLGRTVVETNPDTSAAFTREEIAALEAGYELVA